MPITNNHRLPDFVVDALTYDTYSRGESDISVTQLIDSPRVSLLQTEHADEIDRDAVDFLWSRFGTSVHEMFEKSVSDDEYVTEERLFHKIDDWTISGAIDLQHIHKDGIAVADYKVTSVWSVIFDKQEWHKQLNCYAWLVRKAKQAPVKSLSIVAILRDWNRRKSEESADYPESPITIVNIPMWSESDQDQYVFDRLNEHQLAYFQSVSGGDLPECSDEERWKKGDKYAVMGSGKRAIRVLNSLEEAEEYSSALDQKTRVEHRVGESTRCIQNWCNVNEWCDQFQGGNV